VDLLDYPRNSKELVAYLEKNRSIKVVAFDAETLYEYHSYEVSYDGYGNNTSMQIRLRNKDSDFLFRCYGVMGGRITFNSDGFVRDHSGLLTHFFYMGDKPWKNKSTNEWDDVISGLKNFTD
jgi:hypothetical protein